MKTVSRHKTFIKDMRNVRLTDTQATKLFLYIACLLKNEPLPPESKNHILLAFIAFLKKRNTDIRAIKLYK